MSLRSLGPQPTEACPGRSALCWLSVPRAGLRSGGARFVRRRAGAFATKFVTTPPQTAGLRPFGKDMVRDVEVTYRWEVGPACRITRSRSRFSPRPPPP